MSAGVYFHGQFLNHIAIDTRFGSMFLGLPTEFVRKPTD